MIERKGGLEREEKKGGAVVVVCVLLSGIKGKGQERIKATKASPQSLYG